MATKKAPKKQVAKPKEATAAAQDKNPARIGDDEEELVVFAFRLTEAERDAIHKAAGRAKASKFVRSLAIAAARGDETAVKAIMMTAKSEA